MTKFPIKSRIGDCVAEMIAKSKNCRCGLPKKRQKSVVKFDTFLLKNNGFFRHVVFWNVTTVDAYFRSHSMHGFNIPALEVPLLQVRSVSRPHI
jgi:hypothetical protein